MRYDRPTRLAIHQLTDPMSKPIVPTLIDLPSELRGPRVLLRPYQAEDAKPVFDAVEESREHLRPWVNWVDGFTTVDNARDYCIRCAAKWMLRTDLSVGIFDAETGQYLGGSGLQEPDWELRSFEIGYWMRFSALGHGYVLEATQLLVDFGFEQLNARRIELNCDPRNEASRKVAEHVGFVLEGTMRNLVLGHDGEPEDWLIYSLVPTDWERLRAS